MNTRQDPLQPSSGPLAAPVLKALAVHLGVAIMLFVSFSSAPEFEAAKPIVQATLVQLDSKSPATTQTAQRIAGEAPKTAAPQHEAEELKQQQQKQEQQVAQAREARAAEAAAAAAAAKEQQQQQAEAQKQAQAQAQKASEAEKAAAAAEARKADAARKLAAEEEAKKKAAAEAAKKQAADADVAKKQAAAEAAKKQAADQAKQKAAADAAKKAETDKAAQQRREADDAKARALAELLADETQYQRAQADQVGDEVAASFDDVIRRYVSEQWRRPPTARNGMVVDVVISMLPTGQITDAVVSRSSGDAGFDQSAVQAVRNVGRIPEMQQLSRDNPATFDRNYRKRTLRFKPEDLSY